MLGIAVDPGQSERRSRAQSVDRKDALIVPFLGVGQHFVGRETARHVLNRGLFFGELKIHFAALSVFELRERRSLTARTDGTNPQTTPARVR